MRRLFKSAVVILMLQLLALPARAAKPETPPPGMGKYLMVLWPAGSPIPGTNQTMKSVAEPNIEALGGRVLAKESNRRVIFLPLTAASGLRRHEAVVYLQRIWMGESLKDWNETYQAPPSSEGKLHATPHDDTNLQWGPKDYTYDGSGNIKQIDTDQYIYDSAERLIQAVVDGKVETYKYDSFGNLIERQVAGANALNIAVDGSSNRLSGVTYDAAGNATTAREGQWVYKYDALNALTRVQQSHGGIERRMVYDADDERLGMINVGDTLSRWTIRDFEGRVIREYKADNLAVWIWESDNFYGEGALMAGEAQQWGYTASYQYGGWRHYHLDHLGSVRMVTDSPGSGNARAISEHEYYPFGTTMTRTYQEQINWGDPHIDSMRFAGHWRDFLGLLNVDNTEYLDYMHARYYDPNLGRFLSVDPVMGNPKRPQSWNRYPYVLNNPLAYTDPSGKCTRFVVCRNWGEIEMTLVAGDASYQGPPPAPQGTWEAILQDLDWPAARFNAYAARELARYQSSYYDWTAPSYHEFFIAIPLASKAAGAAVAVNNPIPSSLARVIPGEITPTTLGRAGAQDVFVTAAEDIRGMSASQLGPRLGIPQAEKYTVIEFQTPSSGIASPIMRNIPGFVGRGLTSGYAREFVIPNGPIPWGGIIRVVGTEGIP